MYSTKRIVNQEVECQFHLRLPLRITWSSIDRSFIPSDLLFFIMEKRSVFMCRMRRENFRRVLYSTYILCTASTVQCPLLHPCFVIPLNSLSWESDQHMELSLQVRKLQSSDILIFHGSLHFEVAMILILEYLSFGGLEHVFWPSLNLEVAIRLQYKSRKLFLFGNIWLSHRKAINIECRKGVYLEIESMKAYDA